MQTPQTDETAAKPKAGAGPGPEAGPDAQPETDHDARPETDTPPRHTLRYVARSDRGLVRATNQDSAFAGNRLLVIADGMGGHAAGDTASRLVVAAFAPLNDRAPASDLLSDLVSATREGNDAIAEVVAENPDLDGMGTTVTAMLFDGDRVGMAHVGDSRAYLYRSGVLHQLTHDDTFVQSLVDDGRITEDEAAHHPQRNLLLRALNGTDLDPFLALREVRAGDRYLLCSDGLSGVVGAEPIADTLADPDPERVADVLIQRALLRGGPDNVTVIVGDVIDTGVAPVPGAVTVPGAEADPEATGPIQQLTREMPRVPLPPIPEEPAAPTELVPADEAGTGGDFDGDFDGDFGGDFDEQADEGGDGDDEDDADRDGDEDTGTRPGRDGGRRPDGPREQRRRWRRRGALTVAVIALLLVAVAGSTLWVRSQYYVGARGDTVAVFQGVNGSLLGLHFSSFQENSCAGKDGCTPIKVSDLQPAARNKVLGGILATSLPDARSVMQRLSGQLLPPCPQQTDAAGGATSTTGSTTGPSTGTTTGSTTGSTRVPGRTTASAGGPPMAPTTSSTSTPATTRPSATGKGGPHSGTPHTTRQGQHHRTAGAHSSAAAPTRTTTMRTTTTRTTTTKTAGTDSGAAARDQGLDTDAHHALAGQPVVTIQPSTTTLTVQVTITQPPPGLAGPDQALLALLAPITGTDKGTSTAPTTPATGKSADKGTGTDKGSGKGTGTGKAGGATAGSATAPSTVTATTPVVTVTHTVTASASATATPLAPAPAVPGVTCRSDG